MNYYLLSVTNDFASDSLCKEIAISLSPIVDSPNLKFHYTRNQIIFSFGAETEKSEIYEYITGILYGLVEIFMVWFQQVYDKTAFQNSDPRLNCFNVYSGFHSK